MQCEAVEIRYIAVVCDALVECCCEMYMYTQFGSVLEVCGLPWTVELGVI